MAQDTRKDPRAKVLSMTVRYKSATVDEFIEHHSHDVSRGGIFIKTPSPFPPGTLLKFEIRIQDEQSVLAGVGRVVWKRDAGEPGLESPAGMGVKFIKIDDKSKGLIQRLVESQPEGTASAFEAGKDGSGAASEEPASDDATKRIENPAAAGAAVKPAQKRASTMLGLGSIGGSAKGDDKKESTADAAGKDDGFFPRTNPEKEMPPPEERTVMKQAAELLKQALAEAGGSLDDLKDLQAPTKEEAKAAAVAKEEAKAAAKVEPAKEPEAKKDDDAKEAEAKKDDVKAEAVGVAVAAVVKAAAKDEEPAAKPKAAVKEEPKPKPAEKAKPAAEDRAVAAKPAPKPLMQEPEESGGSGKMLTILLVVAGLGAAAWLLFGRTDPSSTTGSTPENTAPTAMTAPVPTMTAAPMPTMTAAPVPTMTAAPTASASSSAGATPSAVPTATAAAVVKTAAPEPPKPPPVVKPPTVTTPPVDRPKPPPKPKPEADPYG
ncbi:MAG: TIGR02266 family protein [Byssovorax sp.]